MIYKIKSPKQLINLIKHCTILRIYSPKQHSFASIKYVLPAFCDLSYTGMEIANGSQAMDRYLAFLTGTLSDEEEKILFKGLENYCYQDTYAMVKLIDVLYEKSKEETN